MKLKNLLLVPLVIGLLVYGGIKGYVYFKVKGELDRAIDLAAPYAGISYSGIVSDLRGAIGVEGLVILPTGVDEGISIGRLELRGRGLGFLLDLVTGVNLNQPPEYLMLVAEGIQLPLDGEILSGLDSAAPASARPEKCTLGGILKHVGLQELGYQRLLADGSLSYQLKPDSGVVELEFDYRVNAVESTFVKMVLKGVQQPGAIMLGAMPTLDNFNLLYQIEPEYVKRMTGYCARESGSTREEFVQSLLASKKPEYYERNLGFIPGPGIRYALEQLINEPGELLITAAPGGRIDPAMMGAYRPEDMVALLGIELSVNNRPISDLSFSLPNPGRGNASLMAMLRKHSVDRPKEPPQAREEVKRPPPSRKRYIETPLAELQQHLGKDVKLYSSNRDEPKKGILVSVNGGQLDIEQRIFGGKFTVHVPTVRVRRVEVYRRE